METQEKKKRTRRSGVKRMVPLAQPDLSITDLVNKVADKKNNINELLADLRTACAEQPIVRKTTARLLKRQEAVNKCKNEAGRQLVEMYKKKQITEQLAKAIIKRYNLCQLNKNAKPKKVGLTWFKQILAKWAAEFEEQDKAREQTPNP